MGSIHRYFAFCLLSFTCRKTFSEDLNLIELMNGAQNQHFKNIANECCTQGIKNVEAKFFQSKTERIELDANFNNASKMS